MAVAFTFLQGQVLPMERKISTAGLFLLSAETIFIQAQFIVQLYFSLQPCESRLPAKEKCPNEYGKLRLFGRKR